jgi:hypothetical protein
MDRRRLISTGIALAGSSALTGVARAQDTSGGQAGGDQTGGDQGGGYRSGPNTDHDRYNDQDHEHTDAMPAPDHGPSYKAETFSQDELVNRVSDFFGVTAENAGAVIQRLFRDNGRPTGYVAGQEGAGAIGIGLRYGSGLLYMKHRDTQKVFWQGPSFGWDLGGNASRVFTLCYNLQYPDMIFRRFPGVEGSAYFIGGLGVNYQRADDITLAPIRAGVGLRLGANVGYLAYSRQRNIIPL